MKVKRQINKSCGFLAGNPDGRQAVKKDERQINEQFNNWFVIYLS
jgi:hypothetical protein